MKDEKGRPKIYKSTSGKKKNFKEKVNPYELLNAKKETKLDDSYTEKTSTSNNDAYYKNVKATKTHKTATQKNVTRKNNKLYWIIFLVIVFFASLYFFKNFVFI